MTDPSHTPSDPVVTPIKHDPNERDPEAYRFGLHPLVISLVVLYFLILIGGSVGVSIWRNRPELVEKMFSGVLFSAFIIGVPSWLVWRVSRSRLAGNITCALIVCLLLFGFGAGILTAKAKAEKNEVVMDSFLNENAVQHQRQSELFDRAIAGEDVADEMSDQFGESLNRIDQLSEQSDGVQAKIMDAVGQVMRRLQTPLARYNETSAGFMGAGGVDPTTLNSAESIADRLALVAEFAQANDVLTDTYADLERDMRTRLKALALNDKEVDFLVGNWWQGARPDLMARVRESDRIIAQRYSDMLTLLADHYGEWSCSDNTILFDDGAVLAQYDTYTRELETAALEQTQAQREIQEVFLRQQQQGLP